MTVGAASHCRIPARRTPNRGAGWLHDHAADDTRGPDGDPDVHRHRGRPARRSGRATLPVLGTPRVLAWCEAATCAALDLEVSQTSVGSRVQLEHVGASPLAATLTVTATVMYADGRLVRFEVVAQHADDEWWSRTARSPGWSSTASASSAGSASPSPDSSVPEDASEWRVRSGGCTPDRRTRSPMTSEAAPEIDAVTAEQIEAANATGRTPVVFIHGLWLLPSSWDRWAQLFEEAGYAPLTPGLAGRPRTRSRRPTRTPRSSPTRPSARSPTTTRRSSAS